MKDVSKERTKEPKDLMFYCTTRDFLSRQVREGGLDALFRRVSFWLLLERGHVSRYYAWVQRLHLD